MEKLNSIKKLSPAQLRVVNRMQKGDILVVDEWDEEREEPEIYLEDPDFDRIPVAVVTLNALVEKGVIDIASTSPGDTKYILTEKGRQV